jgi:PAS domain S-box-containing protein
MNDITYLPSQEHGFLNQLTNSNLSETEASEKAKYVSSYEIYERLFQHSFHAMYIENPDGFIVRLNKKLSSLFGYTSTEMVDVEITDLFEMTDAAFVDFLEDRNTKGIAKAEVTGIKKSGKRFPCRISSVIFLSESGEKRAMNTIVDISDDLSARWNFTN